MAYGNNDAMYALFRKISEDGMDWLFVLFPNDGWAITRNGERIIVGTSSKVSIGLGVGEFLSLTRPIAHPTRHSLMAAQAE